MRKEIRVSVQRSSFGKTKDGKEVFAYNLANSAGMEVTILNYGGIIQKILVPDRKGTKVDVALGYDDVAGYESDQCFLGAVVGPSANRVEGASYVINGKEYHLPVNENGNNLHSDFGTGFHRQVWESEADEAANAVKLTLSCADGEIGFPGNRKFTVTYSLGDDNGLKISYHAESDADTLINVTNHSYFNVAGQDAGYIGDLVLELKASNITPVKPGCIPTGELMSVKGTAFDFTSPKAVGKDIESGEEQMKLGGGYDHNYVIDAPAGSVREFARVSDKGTGITMICETDQPAFQFYSGNFLKGQNVKGGRSYSRREGLCLETQVQPNAINTDSFPDPVYGPERPYDTVTVYRFTAE